MKRTKYSFIVIMVIALLFMSACNNVPMTKAPLKETVSDENFKITFQTDDFKHEKSRLAKENPFSYIVELEYIGDEEEITLKSGGPNVAYVKMYDSNGQEVMAYSREDVLKSRVLRKNEPVTFEWTGEGERLELKVFEKGDYKLQAFLELTIESTGDGAREYTLELPLSILG